MKPIIIDIICDGKLYGTRRWHYVPRKGDTIMLDEGTLFVEVKRAVWSDTGKDADLYDCWVQLICVKAKNIEATK